MRRILKFALCFVFAAMIISAAYAQPPPTLLWSDPVNTNAIALSAKGQYVVVATFTEVRFYGRSSSSPLWAASIPGASFLSVAISADGSYVAAGGFGHVYFWANAKSLTGNPAPTWISEDVGFGGPIEPRCLAISDDGNTVAACGTGPNVFFWAGAAGKSGPGIPTTWIFQINGLVEAIAVSDDGNHVAAVGFEGLPTEGVLDYWNNAISLTGHPQQPTWSGQVLGENFVDVAISDDGNYVAVASGGGTGTVYYWAGATTRTGPYTVSEPYTWAGGVGVSFTSVDMSCDGDYVIAGTGFLLPDAGAGGLATAGAGDPAAGEVYFWGGAQVLTGNPAPSWVHQTDASVGDVAINDAGTYMAAVDFPRPVTAYFFNRQGNLLWTEDIAGDKLSISCDGGTLAVGRPSFDTAYLFDTGFSTPCCGVEAVGGLVTSPNTLSVLAPYLATLGFAAATIVVVAAFVKRREKERSA